MEKRLFDDEKIETIRKTRKTFLPIAVWTLIATLVLGAIMILTGSQSAVYGKLMGTLSIMAFVLFVSVNNFIRMEKGDKTIQAFAAAGFVSNIICAVFAILLVWQAVPFYWVDEARSISDYFSTRHYHMTSWSMIMALFGYVAAGCFWISNVLAIKETVRIVKPLKITSVVCLIYCWIYVTNMTLTEFNFSDIAMLRLGELSLLASFAFQITALAALIISWTNKKKLAENKVAKSYTGKTEEELRAEIEEKVRREMIEKEVREKMENERLAKKNETSENDGDNSRELVDEAGVEEPDKTIEGTFENKE